MQPVDDVKDIISLASTPLPIGGVEKRRLFPKTILNLQTTYILYLSLAHPVGPMRVLMKRPLQEKTRLAASMVQLLGLVNNFPPISLRRNAIMVLSVMTHLYALWTAARNRALLIVRQPYLAVHPQPERGQRRLKESRASLIYIIPILFLVKEILCVSVIHLSP